jgi:hypothetical protein
MPPKKRRPQKKRATTSNADLEEIRPQTFVIRDRDMHPILKGEGHVKGVMFELTTWRRDGLLARLREHGYLVRTLEDQIRALPGLPPTALPGDAVDYPVSGTTRLSHFDPLALAWVPDDPRPQAGQQVVTLCIGWVVRRRQGRGSATFAQVRREGNDQVGFITLDATRALMSGYAQAAALQPATLHAHSDKQHYYLPDLELPAPHAAILQRLGTRGERGWQVEKRSWPLARSVYAALGMQLVKGRG